MNHQKGLAKTPDLFFYFIKETIQTMSGAMSNAGKKLAVLILRSSRRLVTAMATKSTPPVAVSYN